MFFGGFDDYGGGYRRGRYGGRNREQKPIENTAYYTILAVEKTATQV